MSARQRRPIAQTLSGFDIAIVMLAQMVNLQSGITVISLPQASDIPTPGTGVFIVGYGRDDNDRDPSRKMVEF
uniref:Peptidase S1 domain-containing protein n=1 Tax=Schistosoma mansoni TaxID=6183 RepID=A0A5K4F6V4_SCHMA